MQIDCAVVRQMAQNSTNPKGLRMLISLEKMREELYCAVVCDALDQVGLHHQSPRVPLTRQTGNGLLVGRCKTTLWADMFHADPNPYALELQAVDACDPDDVLIAAAGGSMRSGIWGELLTTAAKNRVVSVRSSMAQSET